VTDRNANDDYTIETLRFLPNAKGDRVMDLAYTPKNDTYHNSTRMHSSALQPGLLASPPLLGVRLGWWNTHRTQLVSSRHLNSLEDMRGGIAD